MYIYIFIIFIKKNQVYSLINLFNPLPAFYSAINIKNYKQIPENYYFAILFMNFSKVIYGNLINNNTLYNVCIRNSIFYYIYLILALTLL